MLLKYVEDHWIIALGFLAQFIFGTRIAVQWWVAENRRMASSPIAYWNLSVAASALFLLYGALRKDAVIIIGQFIAYYVYIRNLQLKNYWRSIFFPLQLILLIIPLAIVFVALYVTDGSKADAYEWNPFVWIGFLGQALLNIRFLYQLYLSEQHKVSLLSRGFWWMSVCGAVLIIIYSVQRKDPVLFLSQCLAIVPYVRNIILIRSFGS